MSARSLSRVRLFAPYVLKPTRPLCPWDPPGKNSGVGCHVLVQGIFPAQGSKLNLLLLLIGRQFFTTSATWEAPQLEYVNTIPACPKGPGIPRSSACSI